MNKVEHLRKVKHLRTELAQARDELKDLRGANRSLARQLDDVTENREFWYKEARDAENERDEVKDELGFVRQAMQEQNDEVQELRLCPAEAEGLKRQLGLLQSAIDNLCEQNERQIDMEDCGFTVHKELLNELARGKLERRIEATAKLAERLATLDAAEAALEACGIAGIMDTFNGLADAIQQMAGHIKELNEEHDQLVDRIEDAMGQIEKYDKHLAENLIQYAVEDILERLVQLEGGQALQHERTLRQVAETGERAARKALAQAVVAQADAELAAHIHDKVGDELAQTVSTERRLRQEAQEYVDDCRSVLTGVRKVLDECQVEGKYDASAIMRIRWLNQRAKHAEARISHLSQALNAEVKLRQKVEARAEALAQLVSEETAGLLERLARRYGWAAATQLDNDRKDARELVAQIREALDDDKTT